MKMRVEWSRRYARGARLIGSGDTSHVYQHEKTELVTMFTLDAAKIEWLKFLGLVKETEVLFFHDAWGYPNYGRGQKTLFKMLMYRVVLPKLEVIQPTSPQRLSVLRTIRYCRRVWQETRDMHYPYLVTEHRSNFWGQLLDSRPYPALEPLWPLANWVLHYDAERLSPDLAVRNAMLRPVTHEILYTDFFIQESILNFLQASSRPY